MDNLPRIYFQWLHHEQFVSIANSASPRNSPHQSYNSDRLSFSFIQALEKWDRGEPWFYNVGMNQWRIELFWREWESSMQTYWLWGCNAVAIIGKLKSGETLVGLSHFDPLNTSNQLRWINECRQQFQNLGDELLETKIISYTPWEWVKYHMKAEATSSFKHLESAFLWFSNAEIQKIGYSTQQLSGSFDQWTLRIRQHQWKQQIFLDGIPRSI